MIVSLAIGFGEVKLGEMTIHPSLPAIVVAHGGSQRSSCQAHDGPKRSSPASRQARQGGGLHASTGWDLAGGRAAYPRTYPQCVDNGLVRAGHRVHDRRVYGSFGEPESRTLASAEPLELPSRWCSLNSPDGSACQPVGTTVCPDGSPWAYALDIAAWAVCQACNTSAG